MSHGLFWIANDCDHVAILYSGCSLHLEPTLQLMLLASLGLFQSILDLAHRPLTRTRFYFCRIPSFSGA